MATWLHKRGPGTAQDIWPPAPGAAYRNATVLGGWLMKKETDGGRGVPYNSFAPPLLHHPIRSFGDGVLVLTTYNSPSCRAGRRK